MSADRPTWGRRRFVQGCTVITGAAVVSGAAAPSPAPRALGEVLAPGTRIGTWRIVDARFHLGGVPVVLADEAGARMQVDVLRRDGDDGLTRTDRFSLFLANRGDGDAPTVEAQGLAVLALGDLLRALEQSVTTPPLLTLRERLRQHPMGAFSLRSQ